MHAVTVMEEEQKNTFEGYIAIRNYSSYLKAMDRCLLRPRTRDSLRLMNLDPCLLRHNCPVTTISNMRSTIILFAKRDKWIFNLPRSKYIAREIRSDGIDSIDLRSWIRERHQHLQCPSLIVASIKSASHNIRLLLPEAWIRSTWSTGTFIFVNLSRHCA